MIIVNDIIKAIESVAPLNWQESYDNAGLQVGGRFQSVTLYLLSPIDLIPDFLPMGFVDDTAIIIWALNVTSKELDQYMEWNPDCEKGNK